MKNPFLQQTCPPDWTQMNPSNAVEDINLAIEEARNNIDAIKAQPTPTYANCVHALDRASVNLTRAWTYVNHLQSVADSDDLRAAINELMPTVSQFYTSILFDADLYAKIKQFSASPEAASLTGYKQKLLSETLLDFELNGAGLPEDKKHRLSEIETQLALKTQKFSENVLDDTKGFVLHIENEADLSGLPSAVIEVAAKKAAQRNLSGWLFTLEQPSYVPFMCYAQNDVLREKFWRASSRVAADGKYSNWELIKEILRLRHEKAEILQRAAFADVVLCRRMAGNGRAALKFVEDLTAKYVKPFDAEWKALVDFAREQSALDSDGKMPPWRSAYITEKLRLAKYDFDPESLRPYFSMDSVMRGMFAVCQKLYSLKIEKSKLPAKAWDDSVELYEISDADGSLIGYFYADFVPRKTKRAGAWMNLFSNRDGDNPALGVIAGNLSEPIDGKPALLSYDDVNTLFHEFGHLIHFFMMDCPEFGLRNVAWDFVELPSQINENWCADKSVLDIFAAHWQTGEKIPDSLFAKFKKAQKFMGATAAMRQLSFGKIDLEMHLNELKFADSPDIQTLARQTLKGYSHEMSEKQPLILPRFTHLFGDSVGYAAGYYSYKWAEVLDADAFTRFEKEGLLNPQTGRDFADKILRVGNTIEPAKAFENFMGRAPDPTALIKRSLEETELDGAL